MPALKYNFSMEQGGTFKRTFKWLDAAGNLKVMQGWRGRMQIKSGYEGSLITTLTTENNFIKIITGYVSLIVPDTVTNNIIIPVKDPKLTPKITLYYDLFVYDTDSSAIKFLYGAIDVFGSITHEN